ncbi:MAG TPA: hypothetical protein VGI82_07290 [Chitinophagaceae bacterium]
MIKQNANLFADPDNEIDLVYDMAPNQTGGKGTKKTNGLNNYSHHHKGDKFSGSDMQGTNANFVSEETSPGVVGSHSTSSFVNDVTAFLQAFQSSNGNSQQLITDFVNLMQKQYGIKVTVK